MITIVYAHPWDGSFNHAILKAVSDKLTATNREYQVIDLYRDGFNPVMTVDELRQYTKGDLPDRLAQKYADMLVASDMVIFIAPVWWGMIPAILKGFFDKAFVRGKVWDVDDNGNMLPLLQVSRTMMVTTSSHPTVMFGEFYRGYLEPMVLNTVGMTGVEWYNCDNISSGPDSRRHDFIESVVDKL